jgi:gliding motility-associated-like protein
VAGVKSYTANTTMLYVDGILVDTKSNTKTPLLRNIRTRISSIPVGVDSGFVGKIDEVRMWNYARTSTEIFNQYNTCLSGNESGLLAYYKANEGKGLTAFDAAAFRGYNDGTASVNTIWDSTDNAPIIPQNCVGSYSPIIQSNSPICNNDTFKVKVIGILPSSCKYQWIGANNFISAQKNITLANAKAGKYFLTITDTINKCNSMFYDSVQLVLLSPTHKTISSSICQGKNYTMPSGKIITSAGVYYDTIVNHNGCDSIITIQLKLSSSSISVDSAIICQGNTYILPSGKVVSVASVYSDTIINHLGCDSVISFKLKLLPNNNKTTHASICFGKLYTLPNGSQVNTSGTYIMYQKNKNGCDSNLIIHLTTLSNTYSIINKNICQGDIFILPNGDTAAISGTYFTTIKNYVGCDSTIQTVIQTIANNRFNLGNDTSICAFDSVELSIKNGNDLQGNYWWNIGGNSNKITIKNEGLIIAMASNPPCPTVSDSIIITYANCDCNYYMPNAFSPNADNLNDIIKPIFECNPQPTNYTFTIYNRWGQKVFETTDINTGWDGVFKLKQQEVGVYDYYIQYQTPNLFKSTTHKGNISLIR